ncbi:(2Fe-2S)-binding protein [Leucobacter soli]|uniref:(2Fe-2S)-binding protein n=1 Tax=Leucobacter soli TaxID=2812850 RepID=UPI0036189572
MIERLEGDPVTGVRRATVAGVDAEGRPTGRRRAFDVDAVCLGYGFLPSNDLARSLGCAHDFDAALGSLVTRTDATGRTSIPTVWSIGDSAGVRGAKFAQAQGALAAAAVASELLERHVLPDAAARRAARRNLAFQRGVQGMFAAPVLTDQLAEPETVVCRCESVTHAEVSEAMSDRTSSPGSVKRITRAGMGKCQGRYCGPVLTAMQERRTGSPIGERSGFAPQAPVKPVPSSMSPPRRRTPRSASGRACRATAADGPARAPCVVPARAHATMPTRAAVQKRSGANGRRSTPGSSSCASRRAPGPSAGRR